MIDKPRIGYAALDQKAHLHAPARSLPIIVVPGIMGTRLTDPATGKLAWNPMGLPLGDGPKPLTVDYERLTQISAELAPDEVNGFEDGDPRIKEIEGIRHYYNLVGDFYGKLAKTLTQCGGTAAEYQIKPRVYCCGYDWRQDNAKSALRLAEVVEEALAETRERKVIIVAHSMGGLVSRYYCRVLGGESKVHRLFLIGSPTMGAPMAYTQLKNGVPGLYMKDFVQDAAKHDGGAILAEGIQQAADVETAALSMGYQPSAKKALLGVFGDVYAALCLGAGRWLTRAETRYFARQIPAIYQLLPNALYCRDHKNWVIFDPAATGLPPTGFMIVLPTLFELLADLAGDAFKAFFRPEDAERTALAASRNMHTLAQRIEAIGNALADKSDFTPAGEKTETGFSKFADNEKNAILMSIELVQRFMASFIDCTSNTQLYGDIYTGLFDIVELRAISAANLAMALRFDEALTVNPRPEKGVSPLEFLWRKALGPALALTPITGPIAKLVNDALASGDKKEAAEKAKKKTSIYMHPRTVCVYCDSERVESGCLLIPTDTLSNHDSNLVRTILIPNSLSTPLIMAIAQSSPTSGLGSQAYGDGTVPAASANPDPGVLSNPFLLPPKLVSHVVHTELTGDQGVLDYVKEQIESAVPSFYAT